MSDSVDAYVEGLAGGGSFDSEGGFTIGWERALDKIRTYQAGDPDAFLLSLVSAGHAYGARGISIREDETKLEVRLFDAYVTPEDLKHGFESILKGDASSVSLDLSMGLHGGLRQDMSRVELSVHHRSLPNFRWRLTRETERTVKVADESERSALVATFLKDVSILEKANTLWEKLFGGGKLGGYAGMSQPCRIVDSRCELSEIPITVNGQMVNRPLNLPTAPLALQVGEMRGVRFNSHRLVKMEARPLWKGAVIVQDGPLHLVVHGVSYPVREHGSLSGYVWTELNRDLSRKRLVEDETYTRLLADLDRVGREVMEGSGLPLEDEE